MDPTRPVHGPRENHGRLRPGTDGVQTGWRGEEDSQIGGGGLGDQPHDGGGRGVGVFGGLPGGVAGGGGGLWVPLWGGPSPPGGPRSERRPRPAYHPRYDHAPPPA